MMRFHWQNLSDGKRLGFFHGRAWLGRWQLEWVHGAPRWMGLRITTRNDEGGTLVALGLVFACYYLRLPWGKADYGAACFGRNTGLSLSFPEWYLQAEWRYNDDGSWRAGERRSRWSAFLPDMLLGRAVYREGAPEIHRIAVPMPEGSYAGTCVMRNDSWKRPLWFRKTIRRAHVDMDDGQHIRAPGKWGDDDGIFGMTCMAKTPDDAIAAIQASANRDRLRYGGRNWRPKATA